MDWPNTLAPPRPVTLTIDGDASVLTLPVCEGDPLATAPALPRVDPPEPAESGATWQVTDDVLRRQTIASTAYGSEYEINGGTCTDRYAGTVGIDRRTWTQWASSAASFSIQWPQTSVRTQTAVKVTADDTQFSVEVTLEAYENQELIHEQVWRRRYPRALA
jgi:hypothetical protein